MRNVPITVYMYIICISLAGRLGSSEEFPNLLTRWDVSSNPCKRDFFSLKN